MELEAGEAEDKGGYAKQMDEEFYRKQRELMTRVVADNETDSGRRRNRRVELINLGSAE